MDSFTEEFIDFPLLYEKITSIHDVLVQLVPISAKWRELGMSLRISPNYLDELAQSYENDKIRLEHVLQKWLDLDCQQSLVNWKTILDAVSGPLIENKALAKKLYEDLKQKAFKQQSSCQAKQHIVDVYTAPLKTESNNISYAFIGSELGGDLVMDVSGEGTSSGSSVISYGKKSSDYNNQLWKEEHVSDTTFFLVPKHAKDKRLALSVDGVAVIDSFGVLFQKEDHGKYFYLIEKKTGNVLTVEKNSTTIGTRIITAVRKGTTGQKWAYYSPQN